MRPGRNLYGRLARVAACVGPPPEPDEEPDEALLASFKSFEIAAGPLGDELVRRLGWLEDDLSKAIFPRAVDEVEQALREGWKPVSLGETWGRLVLDPPRCCVSYYRCVTCQAPLPQVLIGEWFDRCGRPEPGSMRWFVVRAAAPRAIRTRRACARDSPTVLTPGSARSATWRSGSRAGRNGSEVRDEDQAPAGAPGGNDAVASPDGSEPGRRD
jgi:hypothetical protein